MDSHVRKIFLSENRYTNAQSEENSIGIDLYSNTSLLPDSNLSKDYSLYEQYNKERDNCSKIRLILSINPICSNVLFNMKTEIAKASGDSIERVLEGSKKTIENSVNTTPVNQKQAVRDTEYSSNEVGGFDYYCGMDIFNNHLLRANDFVHVNKIGKGQESKNVYNTIRDFRRDLNGEVITQNINTKYSETGQTPIHLYQYDTIKTFRNAYSDNLVEKNGWYGFINRSTADIPNTENGLSFNKILSNKKSCELVDMYPGRELYSFIPSYNSAFDRLEYNWDTFLTYAYSSDTKTVNTINGGSEGAIRCFYKEGMDSNGREVYIIRTLVPHTLKYNDRVRFYQGNTRLNFTLRVLSVGDTNGRNKKWIFTVDKSALEPHINDNLFYKKVVGGVDCQYYFKKLKTLKKYSYQPQQSYNSKNKNYSVMPEAYYGSLKNINVGDKSYALKTSNLRFECNKMAFAENIYGDSIAQIVFKDDIELRGLYDNLGREVSEIYVTIQKKNVGYEEWYEKSGTTEVIDAKNIEQSHAFGKLTAGIDMGTIKDISGYDNSGDFNIKDYNIRYLHSIEGLNDEATQNVWGDILDEVKGLSDVKQFCNLGEDEEGDFYGDLIEFSPSEYTETVIAPLMYRFNTAQRETTNSIYANIWHDEIERDDYDAPLGKDEKEKDWFKVDELKLNETDEGIFFGNINPEGYCYRGNMPILVKESSEELYSADCTIVAKTFTKSGSKITFKSPLKNMFIKEDTVAFYNASSKKSIWGVIDKVSGNTVEVFVDSDDAKNISASNTYILHSNDGIPTYAVYDNTTNKFVWRKIEKPSELPRDSELYDQTFANGCFYFEPVIDFFLKRQDPVGESKLGTPSEGHPMSQYYVKYQKKLDLSAVDYVLSTMNRPCY